MAKLKNKKALLKRVKKTKKGKGLAGKPGRRHLLSGKKSKRKRKLRQKKVTSSALKRTLKLSTPYV